MTAALGNVYLKTKGVTFCSSALQRSHVVCAHVLHALDQGFRHLESEGLQNYVWVHTCTTV